MTVIVYPQPDATIAVMFPTPEYVAQHGVAAAAERDVPAGVPYRILQRSDLPASAAQWSTMVVDFTNPDGHGGAAQ